MTLNRMGRAATVTMLSLAMVLGVTSCSNDYTVAYLYMTAAKSTPRGLINGYQVDYQNGSLLALQDSPIDSGGRNPVAIVPTPNHLFLYVANHDDSNVVEFAIGTDGKLYPQAAFNITGSFPTAAAIDPTGKFLYVTFTYQNGPNNTQLYTTANPGPGGITVFPINADNSLGAGTTVNVGRNPIGIVVSPVNHFVYVIEQDATVSNLLGFAANAATGALTPLAGVTINPGNVASTGFGSGTSPSAIIEDATATHLYVTDSVANQVTAYTVGTSGIPAAVANGTATTDTQPVGLSFDPTGAYLYVANYAAGTIAAYTIGLSGAPLRSTVSASVQAGTGPTCIATLGSPSNTSATHATYLYTSNGLSNNITGEQILTQTGGLEQIQGTPFGGSALPTCLVSVPALPH